MYYVFQVTDAAMVRVLGMMPNLVELNIGRCHGLSTRTIATVATMKCLSRLILVCLPVHAS